MSFAGTWKRTQPADGLLLVLGDDGSNITGTASTPLHNHIIPGQIVRGTEKRQASFVVTRTNIRTQKTTVMTGTVRFNLLNTIITTLIGSDGRDDLGVDFKEIGYYTRQ